MKKIENWKLKIGNSTRGQSIIEVVVALSLVALVILGLVKITIVSLNNANFAKDQRIATKYAQEAIEEARKLKEEEPLTFWQKSGIETKTIDSKFTRTITYTLSQDGQSMNILVEVAWQDSKGEHKSSLQTNLTRW